MGNDLTRLRLVGLAEGVSYLLLLGIAMPLKYLAGWPLAVQVVGWAHGVLFVAFGLVALQVTIARRWPFRRLVEAGLAALLPFGPFVWDRKVLDRLAREDAAAAAAAQPQRSRQSTA
ncbi:MAG TPA: DUF3817 domain-containing protein [Polyangiaceae bacterium LLY-WYZ-14_1]|jgi:integral membrane protein|nr:DUF3817 domain-containing protein [Polyangiaceae bacterium LLY-WYZ-14_1]